MKGALFPMLVMQGIKMLGTRTIAVLQKTQNGASNSLPFFFSQTSDISRLIELTQSFNLKFYKEG